MLISKSTRIEEGDLATFKLSNGDEIVGRVESVSVIGDYEVTCPMSVVPSQKGVMLYPSLITAKDKPTVTLQKQHILMCALTTSELEAHYIQLTTGITTAPSGLVV